jgi:predicted metal-dependent phosphotriesterase family hydrolase
MSFIRTLLGDVPTHGLGRCSAHEHLIIDAPHIAEKHPDFLLDDVEAAGVDLREFREAGGGWVVDAMPIGAGRCVGKLATVSQRNGVYVVCPTGLHLPIYYRAGYPMLSMDREALTELFVSEIAEAVHSEADPLSCRAGVVKIAGNLGKLTPHQREAFAAAAETSRRTGCPIITHTEQGTAGEEQVQLLLDGGAHPAHVVLSHTDRLPDISYHRALLSSGVTLEYDHHFRTYLKNGTCPTADLVSRLTPDFPDQIVVGMDMARRSYWHGHGGQPGLVWLLAVLPELLRNRGLDDALIERVLTYNPARAFAFAEVSRSLPLQEGISFSHLPD